MQDRFFSRHMLGLAAAALLLVSCGQNIPKADALEAQSDGMMGGQAYGMAINLLNKSIKYDGNEPRRWVKLGRAQRAAGMPALAAMSFQHALDLDPANIESLQNLAILLVRAGRYDDAKNYVDPLMALSPDDVAGLLALGAIALYRKQFPAALDYAEKLIKIAPSSLGGYSLKAHTLDAMGHPGQAAHVLAQQAVFNPDDKDLLMQLLEVYRHARDREGIRNTAIALSTMIPDDPRYQFEAARAFYARGDRGKADSIIAAQLRRYPYLPEISLAAAQFWLATLPEDIAMAKVTKLAEQSNGRTKGALCDMLIRSGRAPQVVAMLSPFEKATADTGNVDALAAYANALLATGQADRAKKVANDVLAFDGQVDTALLVRARIALARKQYADALNDAQVAYSDNSQNADAGMLVARVYAAMGNNVLAARAWGDVQLRQPENMLILRERVKWLMATGQADVAKGLLVDFSIQHWYMPEVWQLYLQACQATKDDQCAAQATAALGRLAHQPKSRV